MIRKINRIVEEVLSSQHEDGSNLRPRLTNYVQLLASTSTTEGQLLAFATAYLIEIREPDSRYSGC
jgi:hypothetical protein